jgi:hypothetical protein
MLAMYLCVFVCMVRLSLLFPIASKLTPRNCYFFRDTESKGEWGFKALKQMVKALFRQARYDDMMKRYHGAVCLFACMRVWARGLVLRVVLCERNVRVCVQDMAIILSFFCSSFCPCLSLSRALSLYCDLLCVCVYRAARLPAGGNEEPEREGHDKNRRLCLRLS